MGLSHELFSEKKTITKQERRKNLIVWYFVCLSLSYNNGHTPLPIVMEFLIIVLGKKAERRRPIT